MNELIIQICKNYYINKLYELLFMKYFDSTFKNTIDSTNYYQFWLPDNEPHSIIIVIHGFGEHGGRYKNLIDHFLPLNYAIYALDHIGHGKSNGYRYYVNSIFDFVKSIKKLTKIVKKIILINQYLF